MVKITIIAGAFVSNNSIKSLKDVVNSNEINILEEPMKLFHPVRILLMKTLSLHGQAEFRELKYSFKISDGNLAIFGATTGWIDSRGKDI